MTTDLHIGRVLGGKYRLTALLGEGGMGRVYRAVQLPLRREVAVKLITGHAPHPPEWVQRFKREAQATSRLSHPNSVRLFDFGVTETQDLYMVMELLEGTDLARQLHEHGPLQLGPALQIVREVLLALSEAHALGIVHRDIKPDNVFLVQVHGGGTIAKVMDFGIAGIERPHTHGKLTRTGVAIGTPAYMSPEQAQGEEVDARSDLYSLGVMLFELLTGEQPFSARGTVPLLVAHVTQPPRRLRDTAVRLPHEARIQALLDQWLAKDRAQRPSIEAALESVAKLATAQGRPTAGASGAQRKPSAPVPAPAQHTQRTSQPHVSTLTAFKNHLRSRHTPGLRLLFGGLALSAVIWVGLRYLPVRALEAQYDHYKQLLSATPASPETYRVRIISAPSGASILQDGTELATTPHTFVYQKPTELTLARRGYERQTLRVTETTGALVTVKLVREHDVPVQRAPLAQAGAGELARRPVPSEQSAAAPELPTERSESAATQAPAVAEPPRAYALPDWTQPLTPDEVDPRAGDPAQRAVQHAFARLVGKLFIHAPDRQRREELLRAGLPYANVRSAVRAYDAGVIDRVSFHETIWMLRERRRQRTEATDQRYARAAITRAEYKQQHELISQEFWGD